MGSLIATSGAAIYAYSLRVGRERVAAAQAAAIAKVNRRRSGGSTRQIEVAEKPEDPGRQSLREILPKLPWKWISIVAGAIFVVTMLVILGFELLTGRSVSTYTGGSDGGGHRTSVGFGSSSKASQSPTPTPTATSSEAPQENGGTSDAPARSARPSAKSSPSASSSSSPSSSVPTDTSSLTSTPSASPSD